MEAASVFIGKRKNVVLGVTFVFLRAKRERESSALPIYLSRRRMRYVKLHDDNPHIHTIVMNSLYLSQSSLIEVGGEAA